MPSAEEFKKHYLEMQAKLKRDIRPMIARSGFYNPENDVTSEYQHYPRWIDLPNGEKVVVRSEDEEKTLLGITDKPAKAVDVDITNLVQPEVAIPIRRGRPPKAKPLDLPTDLK